jgi:hypothetical protein
MMCNAVRKALFYKRGIRTCIIPVSGTYGDFLNFNDNTISPWI